jgi:HTH-type transcriptional regulator, sugar sensing transcriptional regulator
MVVNIIHDLMSVGLTEYEAKAYAGLLSHGGEMTSYEIAKVSQIPTSKIYEIVGRLAEREIIHSTETGTTKRYTALDPTEFIAQYRHEMESSLTRLSKDLASLGTNSRRSTIWNIGEYDLLLDKGSRMIESAKKSVLISLWAEEMNLLHPLLKKCEKRKIKVAAVHFGETEISAGQLFPHPIADTIFEEKGGRGLTIVTDSSEALVGTIHDSGSVEGGFSENRGFVTLAEDYIKHDIYIMKIVSRYDGELIRRFGKNYAMLRDIFSDKEVSS